MHLFFLFFQSFEAALQDCLYDKILRTPRSLYLGKFLVLIRPECLNAAAEEHTHFAFAAFSMLVLPRHCTSQTIVLTELIMSNIYQTMTEIIATNVCYYANEASIASSIIL